MIADEAIILAGGLGTRLRSVVADLPKPLAPVAGRPFIALMLDRLAASGIRRCIIAVGYKHELVQAAIGDEWKGMRVDYSVEDRALGTGGALVLASELLEGAGVHVVNGDTYIEYVPSALEAAAFSLPASVGLALARVADVARYGAVESGNHRILAFREKGGTGAGWINAGCYYFTRSALDDLPHGDSFSLENDFLAPRVSGGEPVAAFFETSGFIDIGVPEHYALAQRIFGTAES